MEKPVYETPISKVPASQSGWLLSPSGDLWVFVVLTGVGLMIPLIWDVTYHHRYLPLTVVLYDGLIVLGHGFAGYYLFLMFRHKVSSVVLAGGVVLILVGGRGFYHFLPQSFMTLTFLGLLAHHIYQQYFWLQYLRHKGGKVQKSDFVMLLNVCLMPVLLHFSHQSIAFKAFSVEGGWLNTFVFPPGLSPALHTVFWFVSLVYILVHLKQTKKPGPVCYGKYILILNGFLCFYLPLVVFPGYFVFAPPCHLPHALAYMFFVYNLAKKHFLPVEGGSVLPVDVHSARGSALSFRRKVQNVFLQGALLPSFWRKVQLKNSIFLQGALLRNRIVYMGVLCVLGTLWAFCFNRGIHLGGTGFGHEAFLSLACGLLWVHFFWDILFLNLLLRNTKPGFNAFAATCPSPPANASITNTTTCHWNCNENHRLSSDGQRWPKG